MNGRLTHADSLVDLRTADPPQPHVDHRDLLGSCTFASRLYNYNCTYNIYPYEQPMQMMLHDLVAGHERRAIILKLFVQTSALDKSVF